MTNSMFMSIKSHVSNFETPHYIVVIFAIALQVQITLFAADDYLGLRVSVADLLLPLIGSCILFSLLKKKSNWPRWCDKYLIIWLMVLLFFMSIALLNGYIVNGFLSNWAFVNKYVGFLILLSYIALGGWAVTNVCDGRYILSLFTSVFTGFFVLTLFVSVVAFFLQYISPFPLWISDYAWDGFMANRNAYMVVFVMAFIFIIWSYADKNSLIPIWIKSLFWLSMPMFFIFNESRTGWIVAALLAVILFLKQPLLRAKSVLPLLLAGCLLAYSSYYVTTNATSYVLFGRQMHYLLKMNEASGADGYIGDNRRYIAVEDGLDLFSDHNPLIGAGLGTYKPFQIEKRGEFIEIMDFTGLWLLVETGLLGLGVFCAFFIMCAWNLYRSGYVLGNSSYHRAVLVFLIMFGAMSLLHELMYTRFLWFAMGLALAKSIKSEKAVEY